ncbi:hypothetical protein M5X00_17275 [Paenibacillus alvei]|uniref:Uncharacterized protein n=1 Tax=Paenibacillus alvei TaxID=44250 RepID=A0ABT4H4T8_PAEAL|nr:MULTISPECIES: hypothetical protein [Paenibacillus]EJW17719.1 hypothetical protein PAV_3c01640 [Paenibacillus alvei DSM 29]MCY7486739.1 hypothetical protein [Paenibacillus alvei]MCY9540687.1 hypothetical protein [Paenibacillus alvei]MCY9707088.1 hypothetical protein [Paenibacillus alvei]MCY9735192.1 hypothetical protein [Paenibacillus alvei]
MMEEAVLDSYRQEGTLVRVVRDMLEINDVRGYVVAWDDESVMIRKRNRRVVKLSRAYAIQSANEPRIVPEV